MTTKNACMMANDKNWFIACIRPRTEKRVTEILNRKGITYYHPNLPDHSGTRKSNDDPFKQFSCIVFLQLSASEMHLVKNIEGVTGLMFWLNKPAIMKDEEIAAIKEFVQYNKKIFVERSEVQSNANEFIFSNTTLDNSNNQVYKLHLASLGFSLLAYQQQEATGVVMKSVA